MPISNGCLEIYHNLEKFLPLVDNNLKQSLYQGYDTRVPVRMFPHVPSIIDGTIYNRRSIALKR
ncbi:hypothetical protein Q5688_20970 [Microcoleus sp. herbarium5]